MNLDHDLGLIQSILSLDTSVAPPLGGAVNSLTITGTGALVLPVGTTAEQPAAGAGKIRYDSTTNKLMWSNTTNWADLSTGGTVTSVGLSDGSTTPIYTITNSPVTSAGTLTFTLNTQLQNIVFASPNGSTGQPGFRSLVAADIPSLSYLPLAGGAMASTANITMSGGGEVLGLPAIPSGSTAAASKSYVDATASGLSIHTGVEAATTTADVYAVLYDNGAAGVNATLTNNGTQAVFSVDGYSAPLNARVLIKNQADAKQNGIYTVTNIGSPATNWILTRATDYDNSILGEARAASFVFVSEGITLLKTGWVETSIGTGTNDDIVFGTDNLTFTQFSGAGSYTASLPLLVTGGNNFTISGLSTYGTANQILGMADTPTSVEYKTVAAGTAVSVVHTPNTITINNTGVAALAVAAASQASITVSGSTGSLTLTTDVDLDAIAGLTTTGLVVRTGAGTATTRTLTGTANQIAMTAGDGVAGNPTVAIADNAAFPGTGALTVVKGTTAQEPAAAQGLLRYDTDTNKLMWSTGAAWSALGAGSGTVTSVGLSDGSTAPIYTITNSPVTSAGTLTFTLNTQTANLVLASPTTGLAAQPTFRSLVQADLSFFQLYKENASTPTAPIAAGTNAIAIGSGASASGANSLAVGDGSHSDVWGGKAYANGKFATAGDAQSGLYVLRNTTSDNTPLELFLDGVAGLQRIVLPNNSVWTFSILIAARRTDVVGGGASYKFEGAFRKDTTAASTTTIGTPSKVTYGETNALWDVALTADTTNGSVKIMVTGETGKTIRWVATVITSEVTN
jgi:hypothetical protein